MTDLEGVVGVDSFRTTRESHPEFDKSAKSNAMDRLAAETNALVSGIKSRVSSAHIDVYDGHGSHGLREADLTDGHWAGDEDYLTLLQSREYDAVLFVGQHAMAGTAFAPLCHTLSSTQIAYYKINNTFVGEFGGIAIEAGLAEIPVLFLAGDDKATLEARQWVPEIETVPTKFGTGLESARHRDPDTVLTEISEGAGRAIDRIDDISPVSGFTKPFTSEVRFTEPEAADAHESARRDDPRTTVERIDSRTVQTTSTEYQAVYP